MTHSFKFSTRHLLVVIAAAAFLFWLVKTYYDSEKLAESQTQLRAARTAGSVYLYDKLLGDKNLIGKKITEYPGLADLSFKPRDFDDRELAEWAIEDGAIINGGKPCGSRSEPSESNSASACDRTLKLISCASSTAKNGKSTGAW